MAILEPLKAFGSQLSDLRADIKISIQKAECNAGESKLPKHFIGTFMRAVEFQILPQ